MSAHPLVHDPCHEARLADGWAFLRGERRDFVAIGVDAAAAAAQREHHVHLLLRGERLAVGVVLDECEAIGVAADMLALAPASLEPAQVDDACVEACNVLAACVLPVEPSVSTWGSDPGLPCRLAAADYRAILEGGTGHRCYATPSAPGVVSVTVFEPAMVPPPVEVPA
jgi:hypothetical protein